MSYKKFEFEAKLCVYTGKAAWHYVTVPQDVSEEITLGFGDMRRGWGSLPVMLTIGLTKWKTSIFYERKNGTYMLPVRGEVRRDEKIQVGGNVCVSIEILV